MSTHHPPEADKGSLVVDEHLVMVYRPAQAGDRPDLALLERVLYGLHTT
jgi:hypothetical protein